ncbi:hypothetical protein [Nonomuraea guangzhouensis]|uniref:Uncharacterized protein n=1 Tax=Nonomuraea guangzhouensis TaxID=1291555 RepID=A0ABW4GRQ2_9ACTN|nr:hypothetical protein [Nonomuraea guangzhouensis]
MTLSDRHCDQLLGLLAQRSVGDHGPAEVLERLMNTRRGHMYDMSQLSGHTTLSGL